MPTGAAAKIFNEYIQNWGRAKDYNSGRKKLCEIRIFILSDIEGGMSRGAMFCLKDNNEKIIGVISIDYMKEIEELSCWTDALKPAAELTRLAVRLENQNQGVARILLQYGMDELKRRGKRSVHFLVCKTNKKAIRSYEKFHFDIVGECELFGEEWWCYEKGIIDF